MTTPPAIILTPQQEAAAQAAVDFLKDGTRKLFRIGGYAGTGKTTIAKEILNRAAELKKSAAVCAFTGKACSVLRRKGLPGAKTIHSTIYEWNDLTQEFVLVPYLFADYVLVDEGSMVSRDLWNDLQSFHKPIIVIGDPGQLEPVGNDPRLMEDCDVVLDEIHRQARGSAIIEFADDVRRQRANFRHRSLGEVELVDRKHFWDSLGWADHVLCGFNKTRVLANQRIRELRGNGRRLLVEGERIICLRNDKDLGLFNGMMLTVQAVRGQDDNASRLITDCTTDDGQERRGLKVFVGHFNLERPLPFDTIKKVRDCAIADYGYATTVHKFQGSEADRVLVMDEQCDVWDPVRWRYTAITRAAKNLRYCIESPAKQISSLNARWAQGAAV